MRFKQGLSIIINGTTNIFEPGQDRKVAAIRIPVCVYPFYFLESRFRIWRKTVKVKMMNTSCVRRSKKPEKQKLWTKFLSEQFLSMMERSLHGAIICGKRSNHPWLMRKSSQLRKPAGKPDPGVWKTVSFTLRWNLARCAPGRFFSRGSQRWYTALRIRRAEASEHVLTFMISLVLIIIPKCWAEC